jgi:hypothetical protein
MAAVAAAANPDDEALGEYGVALADAVDEVIGRWVERSVEVVLAAWQQATTPDADVATAARAAARDAGAAARAEVMPALRALLAQDVDDQRVNPLTLLRRAVRFPTGVLAAVGVPPVVRDGFDERAFPDDVYGLTPATFADIDPSLHEPGLEWGAAKAHVHLTRRRAEGLR